jgi:Tfp pilus assembly protein FimT
MMMVILSTVLAMAAPSLRGFFASRQTSDAAAQIISLTQLARSQAITEGRPYRLNIDVDEGAYWLSMQEQGAFVELDTEFGRLFYFPKDTQIELEDIVSNGSEQYVEFTPEGRTRPGIIRLIDRRGEIYEVTCFSPTELFTVIVPEQQNVKY